MPILITCHPSKRVLSSFLQKKNWCGIICHVVPKREQWRSQIEDCKTNDPSGHMARSAQEYCLGHPGGELTSGLKYAWCPQSTLAALPFHFEQWLLDEGWTQTRVSDLVWTEQSHIQKLFQLIHIKCQHFCFPVLFSELLVYRQNFTILMISSSLLNDYSVVL